MESSDVCSPHPTLHSWTTMNTQPDISGRVLPFIAVPTRVTSTLIVHLLLCVPGIVNVDIRFSRSRFDKQLMYTPVWTQRSTMYVVFAAGGPLLWRSQLQHAKRILGNVCGVASGGVVSGGVDFTSSMQTHAFLPRYQSAEDLALSSVYRNR